MEEVCTHLNYLLLHTVLQCHKLTLQTVNVFHSNLLRCINNFWAYDAVLMLRYLLEFLP